MDDLLTWQGLQYLVVIFVRFLLSGQFLLADVPPYLYETILTRVLRECFMIVYGFCAL